MIIDAKNLIYDEEQLIDFRNKCSRESKKVVFASGVYDILHVGHLRSLERARKCGDVLVVGINDDVFAKTKGENRPIQNEYHRAILVAGFECVSCVHIFSKVNYDILSFLKPDVYVMSTTSNKKPEHRLDEFELMKKIGGEVIVFDAFSTSHSTKIIEQISITSLNGKS